MQKMSSFAQICQNQVSNSSLSNSKRYAMEQKQIDIMVNEMKEEEEDALRDNLQIDVSCNHYEYDI